LRSGTQRSGTQRSGTQRSGTRARNRKYGIEYEYEYHFIEYEYDKSQNSDFLAVGCGLNDCSCIASDFALLALSEAVLSEAIEYEYRFTEYEYEKKYDEEARTKLCTEVSSGRLGTSI
jgi:hypothetical protein